MCLLVDDVRSDKYQPWLLSEEMTFEAPTPLLLVFSTAFPNLLKSYLILNLLE